MSENPGRKVGYARVSTSEQSLDLQIDALVAHGVDRKLIFTDQMSGGVMKRPGLQQAMRMAQHFKTDFCVWKLDRLGRTTLGVLNTIAHFEKRGVRLVSITEPIDLSTPTGKLLVTQLASFAELERNLIRERTIAGLERSRAAGKKHGRPESMTPERIERAIKMIEAGSSVMAILAEMKSMEGPNIGRSKVYKWVADYKRLHPESPLDDQ